MTKSTTPKATPAAKHEDEKATAVAVSAPAETVFEAPVVEVSATSTTVDVVSEAIEIKSPPTPLTVNTEAEELCEGELNAHGVPVGVVLTLAQVQHMQRSLRAAGVEIDPDTRKPKSKKK